MPAVDSLLSIDLCIKTKQNLIYLFEMLQMLVGQERLPVMSEPREVRVGFPDLDKFESDIQNMLKVVEKHQELSEGDEKVCEH